MLSGKFQYMGRPDPPGAVMPLLCTWENRIPEEEGKTARGLCAPCGGPRASGRGSCVIFTQSRPRSCFIIHLANTDSPRHAGCGLGPGVSAGPEETFFVGAEPVSMCRRWVDQPWMGMFQKGPTWAVLEERPG